MKRQNFWRLAAPIVALGFVAIPAHAQQSAPWHPDIEYLSQAIPEAHADAFHTLDPAQFEERLDQLNEIWPTLDKVGARIELSRLLAGLRDGHALVGGMFPFPNDDLQRLPIHFYEFSDGLFIRAAHESLADLVGAKVLKVGDVPAEEALQRVYPIVGHDNVMSQRSRASWYLETGEVLEHLGLSASPASVTLRIEKDGAVRDVTIAAESALAAKRPYGLVERDDWVVANAADGEGVALHLRHPGTDFWHHYDPETRLFFLQVNTFENDDVFPEHLADLKATLEDAQVDKFVLDIRNNQGGETSLVPQLAKLLMASEKVNREGRFFVLIGRRTFSSGQLLVNALSQFSHAVFIGEPTGGSPIFYGNSRPNVRLTSQEIDLFLPTKVWMTTESDDTRLWHAPDIAAEFSSRDFTENRDPAMEAVVNFSGVPNLEQEMAKRLLDASSDIGGAIDYYRAFKASPANKYAETEASINALGYRLLWDGMIDEAITIFALNVEDYPLSANAHDSLGEAYLASEELEKSKAHYARSLELDPTNGHAENQIAHIDAKLAKVR